VGGNPGVTAGANTSAGTGGTPVPFGGSGGTVPLTGGNGNAGSTEGGSGGSGGTLTTGGKTPTGGTVTSGGQSVSGGTLGAGGKTTVGGTSSNGGQSVSGGTSATGGKAATGGTLGTGGKAATGGTATVSGGSAGAAGGEPIGGCDRQLLLNADFEQGPGVAWTETSTWAGIQIVTHRNDAKLKAEGVSPFTGDYLAWLGGIPDNQYDHHVTMLTQKIEIPAGAAQLTLSGKYWVKTTESQSEDFDEAYLEFEGVDESVVWQALPLTNRNAASAWTTFEKSTFDLDAIRGRTVTFVAYARTDPAGKTSFFLDALRLVATCGH
jgi:hypothetical protein